MTFQYTSKNHFKHTYPNPVFQYTLNRFKRKLYALLLQSNPTAVLEVGCGEGFILRYMAQKRPASQFIGLDLSSGAIRYARQYCGTATFLCVGDLCQSPFADHSFDLVICSEVLEHLDRVHDALTEIKRVTKRYVLISVPIEPYFQAVANMAVRLRLAADPDHVQFWSQARFKKLMSDHFANVKLARSSLYQMALAEIPTSAESSQL